MVCLPGPGNAEGNKVEIVSGLVELTVWGEVDTVKQVTARVFDEPIAWTVELNVARQWWAEWRRAEHLECSGQRDRGYERRQVREAMLA